MVDLGRNITAAPSVSPSEIQRREQARLEEFSIAQRRFYEARERANQVLDESDAVRAALWVLTGRPADPDQFSSVSQRIGNANPHFARQRHINKNNKKRNT